MKKMIMGAGIIILVSWIVFILISWIVIARKNTPSEKIYTCGVDVSCPKAGELFFGTGKKEVRPLHHSNEDVTGLVKGEEVVRNKKTKFQFRVKKRLFDGKQEIFLDNKLIREANYKDGKPDGIQKTYYENGRLMNEANFKDGELEGVQKTYYENGRLASDASFKNGKLDGTLKIYDENGQLKREERDIPVLKLGG